MCKLKLFLVDSVLGGMPGHVEELPNWWSVCVMTGLMWVEKENKASSSFTSIHVILESNGANKKTVMLLRYEL